jgi:hypothetical protein
MIAENHHREWVHYTVSTEQSKTCDIIVLFVGRLFYPKSSWYRYLISKDILETIDDRQLKAIVVLDDETVKLTDSVLKDISEQLKKSTDFLCNENFLTFIECDVCGLIECTTYISHIHQEETSLFHTSYECCEMLTTCLSCLF